MRLNSKIIGIVLLAIIFGGIGISKGLNIWNTTSTKVPATYKSGEFKGQYDPADIRGSYSFGDISSAFDIPAKDIAQAFGITASDPAKVLVKDLSNLYSSLETQGISIETDSVRYLVALYKGLPYHPADDTFLPETAVSLLKSSTSLTPEQAQDLEKRSVSINLQDQKLINISESSLESSFENNTTDKSIKGKTTFKEVLDWGVPREEIEKIIGDKIPTTGTVIRDFCQQKGLGFSSIKESLQVKIK